VGERERGKERERERGKERERERGRERGGGRQREEGDGGRERERGRDCLPKPKAQVFLCTSVARCLLGLSCRSWEGLMRQLLTYFDNFFVSSEKVYSMVLLL